MEAITQITTDLNRGVHIAMPRNAGTTVRTDTGITAPPIHGATERTQLPTSALAPASASGSA